MNKQGSGKIEYLDYSWNLATGCYHDCGYCYAKIIANRFGRRSLWTSEIVDSAEKKQEVFEVNKKCYDLKSYKVVPDPYPYGFFPTFHRYRLNEPSKVKKPSIIGVVFMGDLFGEWVPNEWIDEVFQACDNADRHQYLFLTKNPSRYKKAIKYYEGEEQGYQPELWNNMWFGATITCQNDIERANTLQTFYEGHKFLSIEPIFGEISINRQLKWPVCKHWKSDGNPSEYGKYHWEKQCLVAVDWIGVEWVIIGAQTGHGAVQPKREWVSNIVDQCRAAGVTVFMKNSLKVLMGDDFIQEWPEGLK
jgi:protein gp37